MSYRRVSGVAHLEHYAHGRTRPVELEAHLLLAAALHPSATGIDEIHLLVPSHLLGGKLGRPIPKANRLGRASVGDDLALAQMLSFLLLCTPLNPLYLVLLILQRLGTVAELRSPPSTRLPPAWPDGFFLGLPRYGTQT